MRGFRQFSTHLTKCHAKCCACAENCNASSKNVAKLLRLPHKTIFDTLQNTSECHKVPRLPREMQQRDVWNKNDRFCRTYHRHGHIAIARTVADGCERKRNVERTHPQPPDPQSETGTLATHSEKRSLPMMFAASGVIVSMMLWTTIYCMCCQHWKDSLPAWCLLAVCLLFHWVLQGGHLLIVWGLFQWFCVFHELSNSWKINLCSKEV